MTGMNMTAIFSRKLTTEDGDLEVTFTIRGWMDKETAKGLEKEQVYRLAVTPFKGKRSLQQNALMWEMIHEIAQAENGGRSTSEDDEAVYCRALEKAQAKYEIVAIKKEALPMLRESFRAVQILGEFNSPKGFEMLQVKVFYGSSKMNVKEMADLLDIVLDMAAEHGIYARYE